MHQVTFPQSKIMSGIRMYAVLFFVILTFLSLGCKEKKKLSNDAGFSKYIEAYTSGTISKNAPVVIRLQPGLVGSHTLHEPIKEKLFTFSPSVAGQAEWDDERTILFKPSSPLKPGELYTIEFHLDKLIAVPKTYKTFVFSVEVLSPSYAVEIDGLRTEQNSKDKMYLTGVVETSDDEDTTKIKKMVTAIFEKKQLPVRWKHFPDERKHEFIIASITRKESATSLSIQWDGSPIASPLQYNKSIEVPAIGDFKVMNIKAKDDNPNYISVYFSSPIDVLQDITGLIFLSPDVGLSYTVDGSVVKIYGDEVFEGAYIATVSSGIMDIWGNTILTTVEHSLFFENKKPSVKILSQGVILPASGKVVLPFEAVNLKAVDISVVKIYERNIPQFLQQNNMDGDQNLRQVGKPVVQKTLFLDGDKTLNLTKRNRFSIDLDWLIKTEPGAMYRITIGFRPEYSLYACDAMQETSDDDNEDEYWYNYYDDYNYGYNWSDEDDAFWQQYDTYYPYGYDWLNRDNPCHPSYYNKERWETRNILVSNIGIIAKQGSDKSIHILVTDLITADPIPNVKVDLLDYQQQVILSMNTDSKGQITATPARKPFLLIASRNLERGYLKLDDGASLSLSSFDVSGTEVQQGIKGYLFAERGVWRPGDSIYVSFILEDREAKLPENHPVEFSLFTPQGQLYRKMISTSSVNGYYVFKTATDPTAPTGNWNAKINIGGASFEKRLKIETIMPNRLKVNLTISENEIIEKGQDISLSSEWLFGAPARNLKAKVDLTLTHSRTSFPQYNNYIFDNPVYSFPTQSFTVFDGKLNADGNTSFALDIDEFYQVPGMLKAGLMVKIFEPGGAYSVDYLTAPYSPYTSYVGVKVPTGEPPFNYLLTGKRYMLDIVNLNAKGQKIQGQRTVKASLYKIQWKWWWDNSGNDISNFTSGKYTKLIAQDEVKLNNGSGKWEVSTPEDDWGRYVVIIEDIESGHQTGKIVYFDDPYWQTRSRTEEGTSATLLSFNADKPNYKIGEKIKLSIPSSDGARVFISVENGRKVIQTYWLKAFGATTELVIPVESGMAPNIYIHATLLQPHDQTLNDLPIRMYGVIPVMIDDPATILSPQITMPDVIKPETPTSLTVSEKDGRPMTYTVAIVDEGLLTLTRYLTPNPHAYFYAKEALGIKTWDMFDQVMGAWGGRLERILTIGGDEAYAKNKQKGANRFKPIVHFMGPFVLGKGKKNTHEFKLSPYFGSVRVMVIARHEAAYGSAEKNVTVKNPVMMYATLPRVMGPTEEIRIPVTVFATEKNLGKVTVEMQKNPMLDIIGDSKQILSFDSQGEKTAYFTAKVRAKTGITKVKFSASSAKEKVFNEIEIEVRNPNPPVVESQYTTLQPGASWTTDLTPIGTPSESKGWIELSSTPSLQLEKRSQFLIQYPHGCLEQIVSGVFAQLALTDLINLSDIRKKEIQRNVQAGIQKVINRQHTDGGFVYWPGDRYGDDWATSYTGHFLLQARARGYHVSDDVLQSWIRFQKNKASAWTPSIDIIRSQGDLPQAYRLYTLAMANKPELGAMNRFKEFAYLSKEAKWMLAAAYQLAGQPTVAKSLIQNLSIESTNTSNWEYSYGSSLRNSAIALDALIIIGQRRRADELVRKIAENLSVDNWYSTQTTAWCLLAISNYNGVLKDDLKVQADIAIQDKKNKVASKLILYQQLVDVSTGKKSIRITNTGTNTLYVRQFVSGQPLPGEQVNMPQSSSKLKLAIDYLALDGKPIDVTTLKQGTDFVAKVTVTNPGGWGAFNNMALSQIMPSGWEILNTRIWDASSTFTSSHYRYQDIRDDRVYTYFDIYEKKSLTFYMSLNAAYMGRYYLPITVCEAMYNHTLSASVPGKWVDITE